MAAKAIRFSVLDVGQGTGNFIETFDTETPTRTTPPVKTFLIDLGSERQKAKAGGPSADWVVNQLTQMTKPELDCVILSHSDSDHINLLEMVLAAFDPLGTTQPTSKTRKILTVQKSYYGGDYKLYKKGNRENVLAKLAKYSPEDPQPFPVDHSSFTMQSPEPFCTIDDNVNLYLMVGNVTKSDLSKSDSPEPKKRRVEPSSFNINTESLVVVVSYGGIQYIATGDATGVTLAHCNRYVTDTIKAKYLPNVVMLTMPHHGSETTTFNLTGSSGGGGRNDPDAVENVRTFAAKTKPLSITASAERVRTFKHPSAFLLKFFWDYIQSGGYGDPTILSTGQHYYTAYFSPDDGYQYNDGSTRCRFPKPSSEEPGWYTVQTTKDIFTNLYFDPTMITDKTDHKTVELPPNPGNLVPAPSTTPYPPLGVAWFYTTTKRGKTTIDRIENRPALLALRRQLVAAVTTTPNRTEAATRPPGGARRWRTSVAQLEPPSTGNRGARPATGKGGGGLAGLKVLP